MDIGKLNFEKYDQGRPLAEEKLPSVMKPGMKPLRNDR